MYKTFWIAAIHEDEVLLHQRGVYLSTDPKLAEVGDTLFFIINQQVKSFGTVTEIEQPNQCKRGDLPSQQRIKYHWSAGAVGITLVKFVFGLPKKMKPQKMLLDLEDRDRVLGVPWTYNKANNNFETRINGKAVRLGRFILRQDQYVYQKEPGLDFRKVNLSVKVTKT